jgi:hypothetical protein
VIRAKFLDPLDARELPDNFWLLLAELRYDSAILGARVIVDKGFVTDLSSVPRVPFAFWIAGDTARKAAVIHDWLYSVRLAGKMPDVDRRRLADEVFLEAMAAEGVPLWRRTLMHAAVRLWGEGRWRAG